MNNFKLVNQLNPFKNDSVKRCNSIIPFWACGAHIDKIYCVDLKPPQVRFKMFYVLTKELIKKIDFRPVARDKLFDNEQTSIQRISMVLERWEHNKPVDPPIIYLPDGNNPIVTFGDGRHRTIAAYHCNAIKMPVAVGMDGLDEVASILHFSNYDC